MVCSWEKLSTSFRMNSGENSCSVSQFYFEKWYFSGRTFLKSLLQEFSEPWHFAGPRLLKIWNTMLEIMQIYETEASDVSQRWSEDDEDVAWGVTLKGKWLGERGDFGKRLLYKCVTLRRKCFYVGVTVKKKKLREKMTLKRYDFREVTLCRCDFVQEWLCIGVTLCRSDYTKVWLRKGRA